MKGMSTALEFPEQHPALRGHFPGNPVVPAVVLLDAVLQLASTRTLTDCWASTPHWQIGSAKFHRLLRPGEPLSLELEARSDGSVRFALSSRGALVAQGLLLPTAPTSRSA